ncbi:MAG: arylsulfatase [Planctomycetota bacterium]
MHWNPRQSPTTQSLGFGTAGVWLCLIGFGVDAMERVDAIEPGALLASEKPNIVLIYTDDQGFGDASCLNPDAKFQTPHLDRLAREGITFTNGHSADAVCTPSRYALLTGRYCWRTRLKRGVLGAESPCLIKDDQMTIASMLGGAGYNTCMVGKWHLGMDFPGEPGSRDWSKPVQDMPLDKGFESFFGIPASLNYGVLAWFEGRHAAVPPTLFTAKKPNRRHVDYRIMPPYQDTPAATRAELGRTGMEVAPDFVDNQCLTRFTDRAIEWMGDQIADSKAGKPFFLYLPLTSPHYPVCPLPEFQGRGDCGAYGEFVIETDHHVGRVLAFLDARGIAEDTMVIFTSDNGPENSWKQRIHEFAHHSNGLLRGGKRDIYEGGHRVPFFVRWPGGTLGAGRRWQRAVGQVDILATLADVVGVDLPDNAGGDSVSFATVLRKPMSTWQRSPLINHDARGRFAITEGDWKLLLPHGKKQVELYDLASDLAEEHDVASEHPEHVERLMKSATRIVTQGRSTEGRTLPNDTGHWSDLAWIGVDEYRQTQTPVGAGE